MPFCTEMKTLFLDPQFLGFKPFGLEHMCHQVNNTYVLENLLKCYGSQLRKIDVTSIKSGCTLHLIAKYCPSVRIINSCDASINGIRMLAKRCKKITELNITKLRFGPNYEEPFKELFARNKSLRVLNLPFFNISGECLLNLPLEHIHVIKLATEGSSIKLDDFIGKFALTLNTSLKNLDNVQYVVDYEDDVIAFSLYEAKNFNLSENVFSEIASRCENLTVLHLNCPNSQENIDEKLSAIFRKNPNIESLGLKSFPGLTGRCLLDLNYHSVSEFILDNTCSIQRKYLIETVPFFKHLNSLGFNNFEEKYHDRLAECIDSCRNLKKLSVSNTIFSSYINLFKFGTSLTNIEVLKINTDFNYLFDTDFQMNYTLTDITAYIGDRMLLLKYLDISASYQILRSEQFFRICNLPELEILKMNHSICIHSIDLRFLTKLKCLYSSNCKNLKNENLIELLKHAKNLEYVDISYCKRITKLFIYAAVNETRNRTNNLMLTVRIRETAIRPNDICEISPLLCLVWE